MRRITISEFLQEFPIPPLHHREPQSDDFTPWVFWSGSENSSDQEATMIQEKIISCFSSSTTNRMGAGGYILQFWAPVDDGRLLSTSGQPFAVGGYLSKESAMYRQYSSANHMDLICGTFLNRLPSVNQLQWIPSEEAADHTGLHVSVTLPICLGGFSSPTICIGVLECTANPSGLLAHVVLDLIAKLKEVGLDVFPVHDLIPYKTIDGLKDEIDYALKVVCVSYEVALAQVWISCEDKSILKLTGCVFDIRYTILDSICDVFPSILARKTLEDYISRFVGDVRSDLLIGLDGICLPDNSKGATICLKSSDSRGDFYYAFEFIWMGNYRDIPVSVVDMRVTLKDLLPPTFKFASSEETNEYLPILLVGGEDTTKVGKNIVVVRKKRAAEEEEKLYGSRKVRKGNDSSQITTTDEYNDLALPKTATLEVDYGYGMIKCNLPLWQATYANFEKQICKKLGGTYDRLEYLDEYGDWICVDCEDDMFLCMKSSIIRAFILEEKGDSLRIQLRVKLSHKWLIGPFGILSINE